ncbi:MAG TPA: hypothetical protein PLO06_11120, partial [Methanoregulaceae archaeon]|nr:hypothetical protein [Methanoregulaceae archaeon]
MPRPQILKHIPENADLFAGISGIIAGLFITSLYLVSPTIHLFMLGGSLALFSLAYLVVKKRPRGTESRMSMPGKIILEIVFFALYVASLLLVFTRDDRPLAYFVLIALCAGCTALSISKVTTKPETLLQILKIFLLSFNVKSLPIFSVGSGIDYWTHLAMNDSLSAGGFISALAGKEQFFPVMHIQTAVMQVIADVPVKEASFLAISLPLIISSVCVFLVARSLFSVQAGLIAMLIVNMTDYLTYWGYATQTTTFGICLFYFLMLVVFHRAQTKRDKTIWSTIFIILSVALVLGHAVSSFIFLVALSGLFAGSCMYKAMYGRHAEIFPSVLVLSLYGIILFEQWFVALYSQIGGNSFFGVIVSTLDYYVTENAALLNRPEAIASYA